MRLPKHRSRSAMLDDPRFRCCGCCHVQTGTILLGLYNLMTQLVLMCGLMFAILHPDIIIDDHSYKALSGNGDMKSTSSEVSSMTNGQPMDFIPHAPKAVGDLASSSNQDDDDNNNDDLKTSRIVEKRPHGIVLTEWGQSKSNPLYSFRKRLETKNLPNGGFHQSMSAVYVSSNADQDVSLNDIFGTHQKPIVKRFSEPDESAAPATASDHVVNNSTMMTKLPTRTDILFYTRRHIDSGDVQLALALVCGLFLITFMMVYGAIKGRPSYLLPFFCFQVFDFTLSCLTAVGHYAWVPSFHSVVASSPDVPFRENIVGMNSEWISLCVLLLYVCVLMIKAYCIGVVWACYQYWHIYNATAHDVTSAFVESDIDGSEVMACPPDYETAAKMPAPDKVAPPEYTPDMAMEYNNEAVVAAPSSDVIEVNEQDPLVGTHGQQQDEQGVVTKINNV